jgi:hypothetical protein
VQKVPQKREVEIGGAATKTLIFGLNNVKFFELLEVHVIVPIYPVIISKY